MSYPYEDFRDYLAALDERSLLVRIDRPVNKDTELVPLARLQYRGLPPEQRRAFLFTNVTDSRGRSFDAAVAMGTFAGSSAIFATALGTELSSDGHRTIWREALEHPIPPVRASSAPCKEVIHRGAEALERIGGVDGLPHPNSTPGLDPAPFLTAASWVTRDPDDGAYNMGIYRGQIKGTDRVALQMDTPTQHIAIHLAKARRRGERLPVAVIIGTVPAVGLAGAQKVPYTVDEYAVAGGLMGRPLETVGCETADIEVPAHAEVVIEGEIDPDVVEPEGPYGEASGFVGARTWSPILHVTCITHRATPVLQGFLSQFPPSETTFMRKIGMEAVYTDFLRNACNIGAVRGVTFYETATCNMIFTIQLDNPAPGQAWQALYAAAGYESSMGKVILAVDEDIDPGNIETVLWALAYRLQPQRDVQILTGRSPRLDPSAEIVDTGAGVLEATGSSLLINATRKRPYPPVSLPTREHMEHAIALWDELGLPALDLEEPWHGYELGAWTDENREEALLATLGRYLETGEKLADRARPYGAHEPGGWQHAPGDT